MTLVVIHYNNGKFTVSGQHESIVICRSDGGLDVIDTMDSGFYIGMTMEANVKFRDSEISMSKGDVMMLYSDGVTEAENEMKEQFGMNNLMQTLKKYREYPAAQIRDRFMKDLYNYMGETEIYDDISMVIIKQK